MSTTRVLTATAGMMVLSASPLIAQAASDRDRLADVRAQVERERARVREEVGRVRVQMELPRAFTFDFGDDDYNRAMQALDTGLYEEALSRLTKLTAAMGAEEGAEAAAEAAPFGWSSPARPDAVAYWLAYTQYRLGHARDALATVSKLAETWPTSGWKSDARALEIEIRQLSGQPVRPETIEDEELRLLAIQGLMRAGRPEALPAVERIVFGVSPPKVKERAVFVLAQNPSPQARALMARVLEGGVNPDLQIAVIRHLAAIEPKNEVLLTKAYASALDDRVKTAVLSQLAATQNARALVRLARQEEDAALKKRIVEQLAKMSAKEATDYLVELVR